MYRDEKINNRSDPYRPKKTELASVRYYVRSKLRKYPQLDATAVKIYRNIKYIFWKSKWKTEALLSNRRGVQARGFDIDRIYWIAPQKIEYSSLQEFSIQDYKGCILGGDWDKLDKRFDTLDVFNAIKQVCQQGMTWENTSFYQGILVSLKNGQFLYGCRNEKDIQNKCRKIESLYSNIQLDGYKSQKELFNNGHIQDPMMAEEEVAVSVGRHGDLLFSDGAHRLAIAKLLNLSSIPVKITVRHPEWIKFWDELKFYAREGKVTNDRKLYQPLTHPDLATIPASHACEDRFQLISQNLSSNKGQLLDIGANLGYFCHRFEEREFNCFAVENYPPTVYFLKKLARAENRKFKIISTSIFDSPEIRFTHFNTVLALNIFHHFLKSKEDYDKLVGLLRTLDMEELFFEPHLPKELQMEGAYMNYSPEEFVEFISNNSSLHRSELLGNLEDGRPLYKLF